MTWASETAAPARLLAAMLKRAAHAALGLLYPPLCLVCREPVGEAHGLCATCWAKITFVDGPVCACCGLAFDIDPGLDALCASCLAQRPVFDQARAAVNYDDASKGAILALKRADRLELAQLFSAWLAHAGRELLAQADCIVPVPLHPTRLWRRRYNQSAVLAQRLGAAAGKPYEPFLLIRIRPTSSQGDMPSPKARRRNVQAAFRVPEQHRDRVTGKVILLVDDVLTTGATVEVCARALKRGGAAKVLVVTIARVARPLPL
jgi:ComF family protein